MANQRPGAQRIQPRRLRGWRSLVAAGLAAISLAVVLTASAVDQMTNHGGPVLTGAGIYITYWGSDFQNGFTYFGIPSSQYQAYVEGLLNGFSQGPYIGTQSQYGGAGSGASHVKGTWIDPVDPASTSITDGEIVNELRRARQHFGNPANSVDIIMTPPGYGDDDFAAKGGGACAWHSTVDGKPYIWMPWQPDAGMSCGLFLANPYPGDQFGHGYFDGVSTVLAHEWAETITDPLLDAWYGSGGLSAETGDKCAWGSNIANVWINTNYYTLQRLWSNQAQRCVMGVLPSVQVNTGSLDFGVEFVGHKSDSQIVQLTNGDRDFYFYNWGINSGNFELSGNTCGTYRYLRPRETCQVEVRFRPASVGSHDATLQVYGSPYYDGQTISLPSVQIHGEGLPEWMAALPPWFGSISVGDSSAPLPFTVQNGDSSPHMISDVQLSGPDGGDFDVVEDNCGGVLLQPGGICVLLLRFHPTRTGEREAELVFSQQPPTGGPPGPDLYVRVSGEGLGPVAEFSLPGLDFGANGLPALDFGITTLSESALAASTAAAAAAQTKDLTLTNTGQGQLIISGIDVTGDFGLAGHTCALPLSPGASCTIRVSFEPSHYQANTGELVVTDNTNGSPHHIPLWGTAVAPTLFLAPDAIDFGQVSVGETSQEQEIHLENLEGWAPLHIQSIAANGPFSATSDCPGELIIGGCSIKVVFHPTVPGEAQGTLKIIDDAPGSPHQVALHGSGGPPPGTTPTPTPTLTPTPAPTATATPSPSGSPQLRQGDVDCDGDADAVDALKVLRHVAGLPVSKGLGCPEIESQVAGHPFGDVDCDGDVDAVDALKILRYVASLPVTQEPSCVHIGEPLGPGSSLMREQHSPLCYGRSSPNMRRRADSSSVSDSGPLWMLSGKRVRSSAILGRTLALTARPSGPGLWKNLVYQSSAVCTAW